MDAQVPPRQGFRRSLSPRAAPAGPGPSVPSSKASGPYPLATSPGRTRSGGARRKVVIASVPRLPLGCIVKRHPASWKWGNQDGGDGRTGVVVGDDPAGGYVTVRWYANGVSNHYRYGYDHARDVVRSSSFSGFIYVPHLGRAVRAQGSAEVRRVLEAHLAESFGHPVELTIVEELAVFDNEAKADKDGLRFRLEGADEEAVKATLQRGVPPPPFAEVAEVQTVIDEANHITTVNVNTGGACTPLVTVNHGTAPVSPPAPVPAPPAVLAAARDAETVLDVLNKTNPQEPKLLKVTLRGDIALMPVMAIKKSLEAYTGIPADLQVLEKDGIKLADEATAGGVGLRVGSVLTLLLRPAQVPMVPPHQASVPRLASLTPPTAPLPHDFAAPLYPQPLHTDPLAPLPMPLPWATPSALSPLRQHRTYTAYALPSYDHLSLLP